MCALFLRLLTDHANTSDGEGTMRRTKHADSRRWIRQRIQTLASRRGEAIESVTFHPDPRGGEILAARIAGRDAVRIALPRTTLDDLSKDEGEQFRLEGTFRMRLFGV